METLIHKRVRAAQQGTNPTVVCRVRSGWVVIGDSQILRGYSLLLPDPVAPSLNALSVEDRTQFCLDMTALGDALLDATDAHRINYQILGNKDLALHAHVTPRYMSEPDDKRHRHPYTYSDAKPVPFDLERNRDLMKSIKKCLVARGVVVD